MCGIIAAIAQRNVTPILLEGLHRLEYRGYDSAGIAVFGARDQIERVRVKGKVSALQSQLEKSPLTSRVGIAHTRWATHGEPNEKNAHPHTSSHRIAVVHNGIIENHETLRAKLEAASYDFVSDTDTEVIAHLIQYEYEKDQKFFTAVQRAVSQLSGSYAIAVLNSEDPDRIVAVRKGSPMVLGLGIEENFIASDTMALIPVTQRFVYLQEGDIVELSRESYRILDDQGKAVDRPVNETELSLHAVDKGPYKHFMLKEIYEQPNAIAETLEGRISDTTLSLDAMSRLGRELLAKTKCVHFVACGTSYHAAYVARYWMERYAGVPCSVEVASEYRYRRVQVPPGTLYVTLSQSGETADSLAALEGSKDRGYLGSLVICNVAESTMVRVADATLLTLAGPEIGVASTKAFTTQLATLLMLVIALGKAQGAISRTEEARLVGDLRKVPEAIHKVFALDNAINRLAEEFVEKHHTIFLGRGPFYPIALEGALKLKEISYIHSEGYPAGELKHGPLALVDSDVPVVAVAPNDGLLEKLKSNLQEVRARGGRLYVLAEEDTDIASDDDLKLIRLPACPESVAPIVFAVPLQMLAYHVAVMRGTDVDQPRNLAKSVTVE